MRQNPSETLRSKGEQCEWKRGVGRGGEREQGQNTGEGKVVRQGGGGWGRDGWRGPARGQVSLTIDRSVN